VSVFAVDVEDAPLSGVDVWFVVGEETIEAQTDADGYAELVRDGLRGPIDLHLHIGGRAASSIFALDAAEITLPLARLADPPVRVGEVRGEVLGWSMVPETTTTTARLAAVDAGGPAFADLSQDRLQATRPGTVNPNDPDGIAFNVMVEGNPAVPGYIDFLLSYDRRASFIAVTAGVFDFSNNAFAATHMGFEALADVSGFVELELTHALDRRIEIVLVAPPMYPSMAVAPFVELPGDLGSRLLRIGNGAAGPVRAPAPALTGVLEGGQYGGLVFLARTSSTGDVVESSAVVARGSELRYVVDRYLLAPDNLDTRDRRFAVPPVRGADVHYIALAQGTTRTIWGMQLFDGVSSAPIFDPIYRRLFPGRGLMFVTVSAADIGGTDPNTMPFDRSYFLLERSASRRWTVQYGN